MDDRYKILLKKLNPANCDEEIFVAEMIMELYRNSKTNNEQTTAPVAAPVLTPMATPVTTPIPPQVNNEINKESKKRANTNMETKECSLCHEVKPLDQFYMRKRKSGKGYRYASRCKICYKKKRDDKNSLVGNAAVDKPTT